MLDHAAETVADQSGKGLAVVDVARPLNASQKSSIEALLVTRFGRPHYIAQRVNPDVVGGARIRVGDTIIDGSIAHRLQDLRGKLAG
jgi:F-type H+-transporting ATPase subunit delta